MDENDQVWRLGSRGTEFAVAVREDGTVELTLYDGQVEMRDAAGRTLVLKLCQRLDLRDPNGGWRLATTLKALRDLEAQGFWTLPAATVPPPGAWNPTRLHRRVQTHRTQTIRRMRKEPTVLILQDTTELNFSTRSACEGLGQSGTNQTGAQSRGLDGRGTC